MNDWLLGGLSLDNRSFLLSELSFHLSLLRLGLLQLHIDRIFSGIGELNLGSAGRRISERYWRHVVDAVSRCNARVSRSTGISCIGTSVGLFLRILVSLRLSVALIESRLLVCNVLGLNLLLIYLGSLLGFIGSNLLSVARSSTGGGSGLLLRCGLVKVKCDLVSSLSFCNDSCLGSELRI